MIVVLWIAGAAVAALVTALAPRVTTAETRLAVGAESLAAQSVPGYVNSLPDLAASYARYVETSAESVDAIAEAAGVSGESIREVRSSPIPDSSVLRIEVSGTDSRAAVAVAEQLSARLEAALTSSDAATAALEELEMRSQELAQAQADASSAQTALDSLVAEDATAEQVAAARSGLIDANVALSLAVVQQRAASEEYIDTSLNGATTGVRVIQAASVVGDDFGSSLQRNVGLAILLSSCVSGAFIWSRLRSEERASGASELSGAARHEEPERRALSETPPVGEPATATGNSGGEGADLAEPTRSPSSHP